MEINSDVITALQFLISLLTSLWKIYIGAIVAAPFGFSFVQMLLINLSSVLFSTLLTIRLCDWLKQRHQPIKNRGFNRYLRTALKYWRGYGQNGAAILAPILLGIPTYAFIARRLRMPASGIVIRLLLSSFAWASLCFIAADQGLILAEKVITLPSFLTPNINE